LSKSNGGRRRRSRRRLFLKPKKYKVALNPNSVTLILLVSAGMLGGGYSPLSSLVIDIIALINIVVWNAATQQPSNRLNTWQVLLISIIALVSLEQLVPLPWGAWSRLPGREIAIEVMRVSGLSGEQHALSLDPGATVETLLALLPFLSIFYATAKATDEEITQWHCAILIMGCLSALLGAFQIMTGRFYLYRISHFGLPVGIFANRNHEADFILISLLYIAGYKQATISQRYAAWVKLAVVFILSICTITTVSRTGVALLPFVDLVCVFMILRTNRRNLAKKLAITCLIAVAAVAVLMTNGTFGQVFSRYQDASEDLRGVIWKGTVEVIRLYWPAGSGLGTFVPVYQSIENLNTMPTPYINHAHNEYLEVISDLGLLGFVILILYLGCFTYQSASVISRKPKLHELTAICTIIILLVHSITDYPLRTSVLMTIFGFANGIIFRPLRMVHQAT
jgi:O-antigen ligase